MAIVEGGTDPNGAPSFIAGPLANTPRPLGIATTSQARVRLTPTVYRRIAALVSASVFTMFLELGLAGSLLAYEEAGVSSKTFALEGLGGRLHRLEEFRGKVILVNFWASWCPPCLAEMPSLQRLADRMSGEAFEVVAINVGESPFRVARSIRSMGLRFPVLLDETAEVFRAWGAEVYPTSFAVDANGRIRYIVQGPLEWDSEEVVATLRRMLPTRPIVAE